MSENGNETVKTSTLEPTTLATTNKKTGNTHRGNRKVGASWSKQKDFKKETSEINVVIRLITERLDQGFKLDKFQDALKNYVLKNFRKLENIVEIITDLNDPVTNFDAKNMPDDLTKK